ncbi:LysR family transcriptional regulator [Paraburkholderia sp.]|uniref:LysR family transcriptional regulator n=1 Tax=Paraburkholderia sp. TaxID=1926495 RepID=UPI0039E69E38
MIGDNLRDLHAFLIVSEEQSFTRAAKRLGVSQSALSQTIRLLEERMDMPLFQRTTRRVSPTEAGERLLTLIGPAMEEIQQGLAQMNALRSRPAGTIRLSADEYAVHTVLWPALPAFLANYPDIKVEITTDYGLADIVGQRYDAGVRRGGLISRDMIAVRIGPDIPMAVVGSPAYFERNPKPRRPQQLIEHNCINLRLPSQGYFGWVFRKSSKEHRVKVDGQVVLNSIFQVVEAAVAGLGLAYVPEQLVRSRIDAGQLVEVLREWRQVYEGYHLYYSNRRKSPPLSLLLEALRYTA